MTTCTCRDAASACGACLAVGSPGDQPLHIHCDEHISRLEAENERLETQIGTLREALALIVGAFTNGVYCGSCGEPVDDCGCVINNGREALR